MSKEELLKYLIAEIDLIMHDKDYRFENQDGTWFSRESCRDLTNEEVFEELKSELMQLNSQVEQIADLEAKLAQSEINESIKAEKKDIAWKIIEELKQQLAEKDTRIEELESQFAYECECNKQFVECQNENEMLKQQLAEKDKEIEELKDYIGCKGCIDLITKLHQNEISFAVDILEELSDCSNYIDSKLDFECGSYVSEKAIRDKIKYLKGKKDE